MQNAQFYRKQNLSGSFSQTILVKGKNHSHLKSCFGKSKQEIKGKHNIPISVSEEKFENVQKGSYEALFDMIQSERESQNLRESEEYREDIPRKYPEENFEMNKSNERKKLTEILIEEVHEDEEEHTPKRDQSPFQETHRMTNELCATVRSKKLIHVKELKMIDKKLKESIKEAQENFLSPYKIQKKDYKTIHSPNNRSSFQGSKFKKSVTIKSPPPKKKSSFVEIFKNEELKVKPEQYSPLNKPTREMPKNSKALIRERVKTDFDQNPKSEYILPKAQNSHKKSQKSESNMSRQKPNISQNKSKKENNVQASKMSVVKDARSLKEGKNSKASGIGKEKKKFILFMNEMEDQLKRIQFNIRFASPKKR